MKKEGRKEGNKEKKGEFFVVTVFVHELES